MMFKHPFNWFNKFGTIPETYTEAMSYEEQIMWLCKEIKDNEGFIDEFRQEFSDVGETLVEIGHNIDMLKYDVLQLQSGKQDKLTAGFNMQIRKIENVEESEDDITEISTEPIIQDSIINGGAYIQLSDKVVSDFINLTPVEASNTAYVVLYGKAGEYYEFNGLVDIARFNNNNEIIKIEKNIDATNFVNFVGDTVDWNVAISFYQTDTHVPELRSYISNTYIYDSLQNKQDRLTAGTNITIDSDNVISADTAEMPPLDISSLITSGSYIDLSGGLNDTVNLTPISSANTAYFMQEEILLQAFYISGNFTAVEIDSENKIINKVTETASSDEPYLYESSASLPANARIVISFYNTNTNTPKVSALIDNLFIYNGIKENEGIQKLRGDIYLDNTSPETGLTNGLYYSSKYHLYVNNVQDSELNEALFMVNGNVIYIIASPATNHTNKLYSEIYYNQDAHEWRKGEFPASTNWVNVSGRPSIDNFTQPLYLYDGTGTTGLANGLYFTGTQGVYVNDVVDSEFTNALILADGNDVLYIIASPATNHTTNMYREMFYSNGEWRKGQFGSGTDWSLVANKPIVTTINSSSTNTDIPSAKAVYDNSLKVYSTTEQRVGTWIGGNPLYQKTFTGTLPEYDAGSTDTFIQITNFSKLCKIEGYFESTYSSSAGNLIPIGGGTGLLVLIKNNQLCLRQSSNTSSEADYYITVQYTKST